jgi:hypothetical protein
VSYRLLQYDALLSERSLPTFWRNVWPPFSGLMNTSREQQAEYSEDVESTFFRNDVELLRAVTSQ